MAKISMSEIAATVLTRNLLENHVGRLQSVGINLEYEDAQKAATELIFLAGFDEQDSDNFGAEMGDVVKSLLTVVMLRVPQLAQRLNDSEIVGDGGGDE